MKETNALIERISQVNAGFQRLEISFEETLGRIKPGQSFLAQPTPSLENYLRERWWPVDIKGDFLVVERPLTEVYQTGQVITALGLIGEPYRFRRSLRNVLLVAYDTPPTPLLLTIPWLLSNNISVTLVLAGSARSYTTRHLDERIEILHGEADFTWPNQVMTVGWADQVFVAVDETDERRHFQVVVDRFTELREVLPTNYLFGVLRPPVPCGTGACTACTLQTRQGSVLACTEGPAFDLTQFSF